jgi:hypothetical protein
MSFALEGYALLKVAGRNQGLEGLRKALSARFAKSSAKPETPAAGWGSGHAAVPGPCVLARRATGRSTIACRGRAPGHADQTAISDPKSGTVGLRSVSVAPKRGNAAGQNGMNGEKSAIVGAQNGIADEKSAINGRWSGSNGEKSITNGAQTGSGREKASIAVFPACAGMPNFETACEGSHLNTGALARIHVRDTYPTACRCDAGVTAYASIPDTHLTSNAATADCRFGATNSSATVEMSAGSGYAGT